MADGREIELTILMPCLNEAQGIASCIQEAQGYLARSGIAGEVLVADNGSTDGSDRMAADLGARVIHVESRGYGAALRAGCDAALGTFVIMGDADGSYDFSNLDVFVKMLREGYDLVMGDRFAGGIEHGAMPPANRVIGNPVLSGIARALYPCDVHDWHCGLRGYRRESIQSLQLSSPGMEYASEMVLRCVQAGMRVGEVPTTLRRDSRGGASHLRPLHDGLRHLHLLLDSWKPRTSNFCLILLMLALAIVRVALGACLPIQPRVGYMHDDALMVDQAFALLQGEWLGDYTDTTLIKGPFLPLFLACVSYLGITYLGALSGLYAAACAFFTYEIRPLFRRRWPLVVLFAVLLFNPSMFGADSALRIYRNGLTAIQVLILFGCYLGMFFKLRSPRMTGTISLGIIAGIDLWAFANTREDWVWVLPFVVAASLALTFMTLLTWRNVHVSTAQIDESQSSERQSRSRWHKKDRAMRHMVYGLASIALPFLMLLSGNAAITSANQDSYGEPVRLETTDGTFTQAIRAIYSVDLGEDPPYCSVPREKLEVLYQVSPMLASIRDELDLSYASYDTGDRNKSDGNCEDGWFLWGLRTAAYRSGKARTLGEAQVFYADLAEEINAAIDQGMAGISRRSTMPSALMSPWRQTYATLLPSKMLDAAKFVLTFKGTEAAYRRAFASTQNHARLDLFMALTGNVGSTMPDGKVPDWYESIMVPRTNRVDGIGDIYQALSRPLAVLSLVMAAALFLTLLSKRKRLDSDMSWLLCMVGMALSLIVLFAGIAYTEISAFPAINVGYLAGAYPLVLACEWMTILYACERTWALRKQG